MIAAIDIPLCLAPICGSILPPGSKSITNRALVCAALARGTSRLSGVLDSQDTRVMVDGLMALGVQLTPDWPRSEIQITGTLGKIPSGQAVLDCAASGTTIRFLSAVSALGHGTFRLDGTPRMRKRPIGDLLESLRSLGIDARSESPGDCPPVVIHSQGLAGGTTTVCGSTSSQFASALALVAPCTTRGLQIGFEGRLVSLPYLEMTRRVMESFGGMCEVTGDNCWWIGPSGYAACDYTIEPDASAASYFFAAAAITGGSVCVRGLSHRSMQGDIGFCSVLEQMGCSVQWRDESVTVSGRAARGVDVDMNAISDTVPTLAVVALFAEGQTTIRNVAHIREKETDRISDLACELGKLGARVTEQSAGLTIDPPATPTALHGATLATYDDHRMAMSLALAGLRVPGVRILNPACVAKTFPDYWQRLATLAGLNSFEWPTA